MCLLRWSAENKMSLDVFTQMVSCFIINMCGVLRSFHSLAMIYAIVKSMSGSINHVYFRIIQKVVLLKIHLVESMFCCCCCFCCCCIFSEVSIPSESLVCSMTVNIFGIFAKQFWGDVRVLSRVFREKGQHILGFIKVIVFK